MEVYRNWNLSRIILAFPVAYSQKFFIEHGWFKIGFEMQLRIVIGRRSQISGVDNVGSLQPAFLWDISDNTISDDLGWAPCS